MKWLAAGDSHGAADKLRAACEKERPDGLLFTGDGLCDVERACLPLARLRAVRGNCDLGAGGADEVVDMLDGTRILLCHGHRYRVKWGLQLLVYAALEKEAAIAVFGHTHEQLCAASGGVTLVNPGSIKNGEYAVLRLSPGREPDIRLAHL